MNYSSGVPPFLMKMLSLERSLSSGLPGEEVQMRMAPPERSRFSEFSPALEIHHRAGVLVGLVPYPEDPAQAAVLLIERAHGPDVHAGQIAFPGGKQESGETLFRTALRESEEEIGVPASAWKAVGELSPLFIPPSRFLVHPFVFYMHSVPEFQPNSMEVNQVLIVPLSHLRSDDSKGHGRFHTAGGRIVEAPYFRWEEKRIWGATAMMLSELIALTEGSGS